MMLGILSSTALAVFFLLYAEGVKHWIRRFQQDSTGLEGTVTGYGQRTSSGERLYHNYMPIVSLNIDGETIECQADSVKVNEFTHPIGTKIRVLYCKRTAYFIGDKDSIAVWVDEEGFRAFPAVKTVAMSRICAVICFMPAVIMGFIEIMFRRL